MIRKIAVVLLIFTSAVGLNAQQLMHYTSEEFGYSVKIPEDWRRKDDVRSDKIALVMIGPENASMSIVFHPKPENVTASQFVKQYPVSTFGNKKGYVLEEKGVFASRDDAADYILVEYLENEIPQQGKICFYERGKEMCVVTFLMNKSAFPSNLEQINAILKSFTFETDQEKVDELPGE